MNDQEKLKFLKIYEKLPKETLLGMLSSNVSEYKEGLYELIMDVAKKKGILKEDALLKLEVSKEPPEKIKCPYCTEKIQHDALVCPNCKRELYRRKGWGYISLGAAIFLCTPLITIAAGLFFQAYAALVPTVAGFIGVCYVVIGIKSLLVIGKPESKVRDLKEGKYKANKNKIYKII